MIGGPWSRGAAGAGRRDSGEPAAAAITAATARGLGSRPPARDLGSSLEKVSVPCTGERAGKEKGEEVILLALHTPPLPSQPASPSASRSGPPVAEFSSTQASPPAPQRP